MLDAFLMGEANQKGNRFVDFDLCNGVIELKITGCDRYEVHIKIPKKFLKEIMPIMLGTWQDGGKEEQKKSGEKRLTTYVILL